MVLNTKHDMEYINAMLISEPVVAYIKEVG